MTLARLLVAAVLLCSLLALAQDHPKEGHQPGLAYHSFPCFAPAATHEEPWRIIPNRPGDLGSGQVTPYQLSLDRPIVDCIRYVNFTRKGYSFSNLHSCSQLSNADATCHMVRTFMWANVQPGSTDFPSNESDAPPTCYAIRSYVVARDSKTSDSTHPVSYSTCEPAARYQLRTTEVRSRSADR